MHPNLIAAFVEDRLRSCPCGAATGQPHRLCRKCLARMIWRRHTDRCSRSDVRHQAGRHVRARAWTLAAAASILHVLAKEAGS